MRHVRFNIVYVLSILGLLVFGLFTYLGGRHSGLSALNSLCLTVGLSSLWSVLCLAAHETKLTGNCFKGRIWVERICFLASFLFCFVAFIPKNPITHFCSAFENRTIVMGYSENICHGIDAMFSDYEDYANKRIDRARRNLETQFQTDSLKRQLNDVKECQIDARLLALKTALLPEQYYNERDKALTHVRKVFASGQLTNVFVRYPYLLCENMEVWQNQLKSFSNVNFSEFEDSVAQFAPTYYASMERMGLDMFFADEYITVQSMSVSLFIHLFCWSLLMLPYFIQKRFNVNNGTRLLPFTATDYLNRSLDHCYRSSNRYDAFYFTKISDKESHTDNYDTISGTNVPKASCEGQQYRPWHLANLTPGFFLMPESNEERTEVYFWGAPNSGTTSVIGKILEECSKHPNSSISYQGFKTKDASGNIVGDGSMNALSAQDLKSNPSVMSFEFHREDVNSHYHISLIDSPAEMMFSQIPPWSLKYLLENGKNKGYRQLHFFVIQYDSDQNTDAEPNKIPQNSYTQVEYLQAIFDKLKEWKAIDYHTAGVYILFTKADVLFKKIPLGYSDCGVCPANEYLNCHVEYENFLRNSTLGCQIFNIGNSNLKDKSKGTGIPIIPFSVDDADFTRLAREHDSCAAKLLNFIVSQSVGYKEISLPHFKQVLLKMRV